MTHAPTPDLTPAPAPSTYDPARIVIPFHKLTRVEIAEAPSGAGNASIPDASELTNPFGTVHGGMLFALGEIAAASAMTRLLWSELGRLRAITRRGSIEYLKPARGAIRATATAAMTHAEIMAALAGARSVDVPLAVELRDDAGTVVARLQIAWFVGHPKP